MMGYGQDTHVQQLPLQQAHRYQRIAPDAAAQARGPTVRRPTSFSPSCCPLAEALSENISLSGVRASVIYIPLTHRTRAWFGPLQSAGVQGGACAHPPVDGERRPLLQAPRVRTRARCAALEPAGAVQPGSTRAQRHRAARAAPFQRTPHPLSSPISCVCVNRRVCSITHSLSHSPPEHLLCLCAPGAQSEIEIGRNIPVCNCRRSSGTCLRAAVRRRGK